MKQHIDVTEYVEEDVTSGIVITYKCGPDHIQHGNLSHAVYFTRFDPTENEITGHDDAKEIKFELTESRQLETYRVDIRSISRECDKADRRYFYFNDETNITYGTLPYYEGIYKGEI